MNENIAFRAAGLFNTDRDWIHPERIEKTYEIIYVKKGDVYMSEDNKDIHVREGQLILLEPNVCHKGTRVTRDVSFYWVHFELLEGELPFNKRFFERFESKSLFKELLHWNNLPEPPEYLVNATLIHILSEFCFISEEETHRYDERAEAIKEWIRINADAKLSVSKIAEHFGFSSDHISRLCKNNYGITAGKMINRFILARAKALLCNTEKYVKEISAELGFSNDKEFIGYFKYHEGCFPSEYRKRFPMIHMNKR